MHAFLFTDSFRNSETFCIRVQHEQKIWLVDSNLFIFSPVNCQLKLLVVMMHLILKMRK